MTKTLSPLMTRSELILHFIWRQTRETPDSVEDFSEDVVSAALTLGEKVRPADFKLDGTPFQRQAHNGQKLRRWMNPDVSARPSVDVENVLVLALKEPYRSECEAALALQRGGVFIAIHAGAATFANAGDLLASVSKTCEALAPVLADTVIDAQDSETDLLHLQRSLAGMASQVGALLRLVNAALEAKGCRVVPINTARA